MKNKFKPDKRIILSGFFVLHSHPPAVNGGSPETRNKKCFGYFLVEILDYLCYNKNKSGLYDGKNFRRISFWNNYFG